MFLFARSLSMMNTLKLAFVVAAVFISCVLANGGNGEDNGVVSDMKNTVRDNTCGENLTWSLSNGVLTISGDGKMTDFSDTGTVPWRSDMLKLTTVIVEEGVTSIGSYAFDKATKLTNVTLPSTLTSIGNYSFDICRAIVILDIPDNVEI